MARTRAWSGRRVGAKPGLPSRWVIAAAGVVMQLALGGVNAWSVFRDPLIAAFGWTISEVTWVYTLITLVFSTVTVAGGVLLNRFGPRRLGLASGLLYGLGVGLAGLSDGRLWFLCLTYGVVAGAGLGLAFVLPVATLVKWFPDRRGFIAGVGIAGFGAGPLVVAPVAAALIEHLGLPWTFGILGIAFAALVGGAALLMSSPPEGYCPPGWEPSPAQAAGRSGRDFTLREALRTPQWYGLAALPLLLASAGKGLISQTAPMAQELAGVGAMMAAALVGATAVGNMVGRLVCPWLSDTLGRRATCFGLFVLQAAVWFLIPASDSFVLFALLASLVLLTTGGGQGVVAAQVADYFGAKNTGSVLGLMLTLNGPGGVIGPMLLASVRESTGTYTPALYTFGGLMLLCSVIPIVLRPPAALAAVPTEPGLVLTTPTPARGGR